MSDELVTVVIPVYNGERTVKKAVMSALSQTHSAMQVICINDGSNDGSLQVLQSFGSRIELIDQQNKGVAGARNAGIRRSNGRFIAFLDQDDFWAPSKIELQLQELRDNEHVGLVHTEAQYVDVETEDFLPLLNPNAGTTSLTGKCREALLLGNGIYNSSVLVRSSVLNEVGGCSEQIEGNSVQDYDLWLRCSDISEFRCVSDRVTFLGIHSAQGLWNRERMLGEEAAVLLRHLSSEEWKSWPSGARRMSNLYLELATTMLDQEHNRGCRTYAARSTQFKFTLRAAALYCLAVFPNPVVRVLRKTAEYCKGHGLRSGLKNQPN